MDEKRNLFIDCETSGLDVGTAVLLSVGMQLEAGPNDPSPALFTVVILPTEEQWSRASPDALKVNGFTWEQLCKEGIPLSDASDSLIRWLLENNVNSKTAQYIGQNSLFDIRFLQHHMPELNWADFPYINPIDTLKMAKSLSYKDKTLHFENFKGWGIARALGVEEENELHTAVGGVYAVRRNYYALVERTNKLGKK